MATVTVQGAHAQVVTLTYDSPGNALLAQYIANAITTGINDSHTITPADSAFSGSPPSLPSPQIGEYVQDTTGVGLTILPANTDYFVAASNNFNVEVKAGPVVDPDLLAGTSNGKFIALAGSGNIITGGGNVEVILRPSDNGSWQIVMGGGNDTVSALGSGNDTISLGSGNNSIQLGGANYAVTTSGAATISATTGAETVTGLNTNVIYGTASTLTFVAAGGATVFGGTGSDSVTGGSGPDYFQGGSAGNNVLTAGVGAATLFGGGSGDQLTANGSGNQILYAGSGNETLTGSTVSGAPDTFVGSAGNTTVFASPSAANQFEFIHGSAGGTEQVQGLTSIDQVDLHLSGYASNSLASVASQNNAGGNLNILLTDGTQIQFLTITSPLTNSNFS